MKLTIVKGDGWIGVYDPADILIYQDETIDTAHAMNLVIKYSADEIVSLEFDCDWMEEVGELPNDLIDVVTVPPQPLRRDSREHIFVKDLDEKWIEAIKNQDLSHLDD